MTPVKAAESRGADGKKPTPKDPPPSKEFLPPLAPRPTLFRVLSVAVVIWILALIALYILTVRPLRYPAHPGSADTTTVP